MTPEQARETVDVIAYTLTNLERERQRAMGLSPYERRRVKRLIEETQCAIGAELEALVQAGHVAELAGLGAAVERWRR